ncbi:uroporphyrinogen decarboxylase [Fastidiosibacter lacustris]|uniref:uroporphyrinogen decarboxylase n=1 Tax=Fastidiosibacter lacustris TaxID=2056695 RepID=UPI000E345BC2|nr:uroporphyrinogen decarboxylase [Fastidiosibacter lacustris]
MRTLFLDALLGKPVEQTPLWIMRQAGRYLPEYRKTRAKFNDFMQMCRNSEACCEVALQPLDRYELDAAIVFSDILTIPEAMGMELKFISSKGPVFPTPLTTQKDIDGLDDKNALEKLKYVMDAVSTTKLAVKNRVPLIGFSGSPWTLAAYMVEGQGSKQFTEIRKMLYSVPFLLHTLLKKLAHIVTDYLDQQIQAGADAIMIFDTWGGVLTEKSYALFSLNYMRHIIAELKERHPNVPVTLFTKGGGLWLDQLVQVNCSGVGIDWSIDIMRARGLVADKVALQGNLDPAVLYGDHNSIRNQVKYIVESQKCHSKFVFNLGHGIYPDIDPDKVKTMVNAVREFGMK